MTLQLVPTWRRAYRWFSVQAAVLLVVVSAVREGAQQLVDSVPSLGFIAHAHWYPPTMIVLGSLAALLRLVHQPVEQDAAVPVVYVHQPEGNTMNANFSALFNFALKAIIGVQQLSSAQPTALAGPDKKAAVVAIAQASVDPTDTSTVGTILSMIDPIVAALNAYHPLFAKPAAPDPAPSQFGLPQA